MSKNETVPGTAITITPQFDQAKLQRIQTEVEAELTAFAGGLTIDDDSTAEVIGCCLTEELGRLDVIEAMRTQATGPLNQLKRTIDGWFKPARDRSTALISQYKGALGAWHLKKEAVKDAALALAAHAAKTADVATLTQALTVANAPSSNPVGTSYTTQWKARITDLRLFIDAAVEQKQYYLIRADDSGLQRFARDGIRPESFPGVVFEKTAQVRASHG